MDISALKAFLDKMAGKGSDNGPRLSVQEGADLAEVYPFDEEKLANTEEEMGLFLDICRGCAEEEEASEEGLALGKKFMDLARKLSSCERAWVDYLDYDMEEDGSGKLSYSFCALDLVLEGPEMSYVLELDWESPEE